MKNNAVNVTRLLGVTAMISVSSLSAAMETLLESELRVAGQYDDNINLTVENEEVIHGVLVNPKANLTMRTENSSSNISADLRFSEFNREDYDSDDQYLNFTHASFGERYEFSLNANVTHDTTRTSEEAGSGRFSNERRDLYSLAPTWAYYVTDRNLFTLQASVSTVDYKDPRYTGYDYGAAYAEWTYIIDEQLRVFLRANVTTYESDGLTRDYRFTGVIDTILGQFPFSQNYEQTYFTQTDTSGFQVGASYQWNEKLSFFGLFGNSDTDTSYDVETPSDQCNNAFWVLERGICDLADSGSSSRNSEANMTWQEERQTFKLGYSYTTQPSSDGYLLQYQRVDLTWIYQLTETGKIDLTTTWGENRELDTPDGVIQTGRSNRDFITAVARYTHRLTEHWYINADIRYRQQERELDIGEAEGLGGRIGISYFPQKLQW